MRGKISAKIIACVVACSIIISAVVGVTGIKGATSVIKKEAYDKISSIAESRGNEYSIEIQKTENTVKEYAKVIADAIDMSSVSEGDYMDGFQEKFAPLTKSIGLSNKGIVGLYINFNPELTAGEIPYDLAYYYYKDTDEGEIYLNSYTMDDYDEKNEDLDWYYEPVKEKQGVWSKPYVDPESDNTNMISYTMPVYKDGQLLGVAGLDISFENLQKMILDTSLYDTGNAFLLDKDYTFIVDKDKTSEDNLSTMEDGKYNSIVEEIEDKRQSVLELEFEGEDTVIGYYRLSNDQVIGVRVPAKEVFERMNDLTFVMIAVILVGLIISIALALFISRKISKPVETATRFIQKLAKLDLTNHEENIDKMALNKDETGLMIRSLINQRDELIKIVKVLKENAIGVLQHSDIISIAGNETVESISIISGTMEELLGKAEEQTKEARNGYSKLNTLASEIGEIVVSLSKLEKYSEEMKKVKDQGSDSINVLSEKLKLNVEAAMRVGENIEELLKKSNMIEEIITMISAISKQTKVLSLNASIESEKAGQTGKGFAIIAKEIRKLSERAAESTSEIQRIVEDIQKEIDLGKKNMDSSKEVLEEANSVMTVSNEAFGSIGKSINDAMEQIKNLAISMKKVDKDKDDVLSSIEEISLIVEELASSVENVTKSVGEQEIAMQHTFERTVELKKVSENLNTVVEKFEI